mgnify:CR=1 FL=1
MRKRTGKFYSRNEKETLSKLGLTPAPMSGAGWIIKEDGENEIAMVQLKSTDASSYRIDLLDLKKLEYHAEVSNKVPIFLVQFLTRDKLYAILSIEDIKEVSKALETGETPERITFVEQASVEQEQNEPVKKIKASTKAREQFFRERSESYGKRKK